MSLRRLALALSVSIVTTITAAAIAVPAVATTAPPDPGAPTPAGEDGGREIARPAGSRADFTPGQYIVVLRDPAATTYTGGVAGLRATASTRGFRAQNARTTAYTDYLTERQRGVARSVGARPTASYTLTTNGFAAQLTGKQAASLAADPRVRAVVRNELLHVADATTSTGYLGLEGENGVWARVGGVAQAGRGVVVGVVDTGIAPENPSFAGAPLGTADGPEPYRSGDQIVFHKSDGSDFHGVCQTGDQLTAAACTTKIVGARYFVDGFGAENIGGPAVGEYLSPRDGDGHGSHTASTAAGDTDVAAGAAHISGVTPAAKVAVYKACWSGPLPQSQDDDGCATVDLLAAIDAAVGDGVDVINYSIGGGAAQTTNSLTDQAFMGAAAAGIFVAAAGGNAGPDVSTVDNAAPWVTTVAASTIPAPEGTVELGDGTSLLGATSTVPDGGVSGRLVEAAAVATPGADRARAALCAPGTLDPAATSGAIVLCDRGEVDRVAKSAEVERAGGAGMVLVNPSPSSTDVDPHSVPTVHVDAVGHDVLHAYAATAGATATLRAGNHTDQPSSPDPQVAGFSSRGPVEADGSDIVKPDVAAPGVNILAALNNATGQDPTWGYLSGTSMASPHVAGLAALYLGTEPGATPAEVKSALMTSTTDTVDAAGAPAPDPFAQGNGQVVPTRYLQPGLLYLNDVDDWEGYLAGIDDPTADSTADPIDGSELNLPSVGVGGLAGVQTVTRTVTATRSGTYQATVSGLPGVTATVSPATLDFSAAGEAKSFTITFTRIDAPLGDFTTGYLTWTPTGPGSDGAAAVRSSLAVRPVAFDAPREVAGAGTDGSVAITASVGETATVDLAADGLAHGRRVEGTGTAGGPSHRYALTVPDDASFLRVDLDAADDTADLDLTVYRRTPAGTLSQEGQSATGSADERVDLTFLQPGTYVLDVDFYAAGASPELDYALTTYLLSPSAREGDFTLDPATLDAQVGDQPVVTASWTGLRPGHYVGLVRFGATGISTVVTVDAGDDVPVEPGTPELSVDPGETGWVVTGGDLRVTATGLTPGEPYAATVDDGAPVRTGKAGPDGGIDWLVSIPDGVDSGPHVLHLTGPGADLSAPFKVTPVAVVDAYGFPFASFDGRPTARIDATYAGSGTLRFHLEDAETGEVFLDREEQVASIPVLPTVSTSSPRVKVAPGTLSGSVTAVLPDGSDGPVFRLEDFEAEATEPGSISFTPVAADPGAVDVAIDNRAGTSFNPTVVYVGCDGRRVVASGFLRDGRTTQRWDLTGFLAVSVRDEGTLLAGYTNRDPSRCGSDISIFQDYWATYTATPTSAATYDPDRPITMRVSFRYSPGSDGFALGIGEGKRYEHEIFYEQIPTERVTERGPVVTRTTSVPSGVATWANTTYEAYLDPPGIHILGLVYIEAPPITLAELRPPRIRPGRPSVSGRAVVGRTLRAVPGTWSPAGVRLTYRWLRDGTPIGGATGRRYHLRPRDGGHRVAVRVTGTTTAAPAVTRTSAGRAVLRRLTVTPKPRITGPSRVGARLSVVTGTWRPGTIRLSVRWLRGDRVVAWGRHYTVRRVDRGSTLRAVVTGHRDGYATVSRASTRRHVR